MMSSNIPYDIQKLENTLMITTNENGEYTENEDIPFNYVYDYLYHGIRFQRYLEKLENIFKTKKILAGKYIEGYYSYSDNCNKGEYVSLLKYSRDNNIEYEIFIGENISLLVTPLCDAIETKYVNFDTWLKIQKEDLKLRNIYSYMHGECMVLDFISLDMVKAIGVPSGNFILRYSRDYVNKLLEDIQILMQKYDIDLPVVDTSRYNHVLVESTNQNRKIYKK